jgi:rubredoxin
VKCGFCGHEFDEHEGKKGCGGCPGGCHSVHCPRCNYQNPVEPDMIRSIKKFFSKNGTNKGDK